jgi:hypothetical protein
MSGLSLSSKSFLREDEYAEVVDGGLLERVEALESLMQRDENGELYHSKKKINETMQKYGIDKHIVKNALHLQNRTLEEIRDIMSDFKDYLSDNGLTGILEWHPNDTTQNSYHFHFYTDDNSKRTHALLDHFILSNGLANKNNIDIQGKYDSFKNLVDDIPKVILNDPEYINAKKLNEKVAKEKPNIKQQSDFKLQETVDKLLKKHSKDNDVQRYLKSLDKSNQMKEKMLDANDNVKKAKDIVISDERQNQMELMTSIFDKLKQTAKETNIAVEKITNKAVEFKSQLAKVPKSDKKARINMIKDELKRVNRNRSR